MLVKCIWHKYALSQTKRYGYGTNKRAPRHPFIVPPDLRRPDLPLAMTSRAQRGDPMKSNRRANPLQATLRVVPGRLVLENDGATSWSNWPAELRSGRQEPTMTILLIADRTWRSAWDRSSSQRPDGEAWSDRHTNAQSCFSDALLCNDREHCASNCRHFALGLII